MWLYDSSKYLILVSGNIRLNTCDSFRVHKTLQVDVLKTVQKSSNSVERKSVMSELNSQIPGSETDRSNGEVSKRIRLDLDSQHVVDNDLESTSGNDTEDLGGSSIKCNEMGSSIRKMTTQEWLTYIEANFIDVIISGLAANERKAVQTNVASGTKLTFKQNKAVIASVNYQIHQRIGNSPVPIRISRYLSSINFICTSFYYYLVYLLNI